MHLTSFHRIAPGLYIWTSISTPYWGQGEKPDNSRIAVRKVRPGRGYPRHKVLKQRWHLEVDKLTTSSPPPLKPIWTWLLSYNCFFWILTSPQWPMIYINYLQSLAEATLKATWKPVTVACSCLLWVFPQAAYYTWSLASVRWGCNSRCWPKPTKLFPLFDFWLVQKLSFTFCSTEEVSSCLGQQSVDLKVRALEAGHSQWRALILVWKSPSLVTFSVQCKSHLFPQALSESMVLKWWGRGGGGLKNC